MLIYQEKARIDGVYLKISLPRSETKFLLLGFGGNSLSEKKKPARGLAT